ncbi:MAG: hypothetical protein OSB38_33280 [Paraburkholderia fungorum]|nr:hypothetical protein [Paraburkholderia fungorum]
MTDYVTRVELHNEQKDDYPKLHAEMDLRGFGRTIWIEGKHYHMPHATYLSNGALSSKDVYDLAQAAVTAIGRKGGVVVTASAGIWGGGLRLI